MKKFKWLLGILLLALVPMLQSCDDDGYSIGDFSWDWATVRATGGGGYYLEGDNWGVIDPVATLFLGLNRWTVNVSWLFLILCMTWKEEKEFR